MEASDEVVSIGVSVHIVHWIIMTITTTFMWVIIYLEEIKESICEDAVETFA